MREKAERFFKYMELKGLNDNQVTVSCGLSVGLLSQARSGKSDLGNKTIEKILKTYQDLNKVWLLTGDGNMLNTKEVHQVPMEQELHPYTENKNKVKYYKGDNGRLFVRIPVVPCYALGSPEDEFANIVENDDIEIETFDVDRVGRGKYFAFKVDGDSMCDGSKESFERGDLVLVRELDKDDWMPRLHFDKWPFWVVVFGNNVRLKQIVSQDEETITLHSLNPSPEYTDFNLKLSDVSRLFNVIRHKPKERGFG